MNIETREPTENLYRIQWHSRLTGFESAGSPIFTAAEAESACHALNGQHPQLHHWPELGFRKMLKFLLKNLKHGSEHTIDAFTAAEALDVLASYSGFSNFSAACEVGVVSREDIEVVRV